MTRSRNKRARMLADLYVYYLTQGKRRFRFDWPKIDSMMDLRLRPLETIITLYSNLIENNLIFNN